MHFFSLSQLQKKHYDIVGMLPKFKHIHNRNKSIFCRFVFVCICSFVCVGTICIHG